MIDEDKYEAIGEPKLRELVSKMNSPSLEKIRSDCRSAKTSTLIGTMIAPSDHALDQLVEVIPAEVGEELLNEAASVGIDEDELVMIAVLFAVQDEIDKRHPISTHRAKAEELCDRVDQISRQDRNDEVEEVDRRIDQLCAVVRELALLVRGPA